MSLLRLVLLFVSTLLILVFAACNKKSTLSNVTDNSAPDIPSNPVPSDNARNQSLRPYFEWTCSDPDGDSLTYDVYFGLSSSPPSVASGLVVSSYRPDTLLPAQTYYWMIVAHDNHHQSTEGPIWQFTTIAHRPGDMVYVPEGPFTMGSDSQSVSQPVHTVTVPAFYIDVYEVTNAEYKAFCDSTNRPYPGDPNFLGISNYFINAEYANYPVVLVNSVEAEAYAEWAGKRLPTEAEWERAAKGNMDNRRYPWGNAWVRENGNVAINNDGYTYPAAVGTFSNGVSPVGCYDMMGNVEEWSEDDWHDSYDSAPANGSAWVDVPRDSMRVLRGGDFGDLSSEVGCSKRRPMNFRYSSDGTGFRCAKTP